MGYISVQSLDAKVKPLGSMASSCSAMKLIPLFTSLLLLMRLC